MESEQTVRLSFDRQPTGTIARLTLDRPTVRNALRPSEWQQLRRHAEAIRQEGAVRVIVLSGAGGAFSSGGDLKTMPERLGQPVESRRAQLLSDGAALLELRRLAVPIVSLIDGACTGAGLALALIGDLRIATEGARFAAPFLRVGLGSDFAVRYLLGRAVGESHAAALLLLGTSLDGRGAERLGLVQRCVADAAALEREGAAIAEQLLAQPPLAQASLLRSLAMPDNELEAALARDAEEQAHLSRTADAREGVQAFFDKRPPRFLGR